MEDEGTVSLALFSGTDDKLQASAVLTVGAAAMGRKVNVFLQYWALDAFRADRVLKDHGVSPEAGEEGLHAMQDQGKPHWSDLYRQAKDLGEVRIYACADSLRCSRSRKTTSIPWSTACGASPRSSRRRTAR